MAELTSFFFFFLCCFNFICHLYCLCSCPVWCLGKDVEFDCIGFWSLPFLLLKIFTILIIWAAPSEFVTYRLCEQRRFRRACASAQSRQNLRCSLIQTVSQEEPSDRKPDPCPLWMAGHAQLKFVMTECSKTQIRLTGPICVRKILCIEVCSICACFSL